MKFKNINLHVLIFFFIYLITTVLDKIYDITFKLNKVKLLNLLLSNNINIILILLPIIAIVITYYLTDLRKLVNEYGYKIAKRVVPHQQKKIIIEILFFVFISIFVVTLNFATLTFIYIVQSVIIGFKIVKYIADLNNDIVESYIYSSRSKLLETIKSNSISIDTKVIFIIGKKSINLKQDSVTDLAVKSLNIIMSDILKNRNSLIANSIDKETLNKLLKKLYLQMIEICSLAYNNNLKDSGAHLYYLLSEPLINCSKYENISTYKKLARTLQQRFVFTQFIEDGFLDSSLVVDILEIALTQILKDKISNEWESEIIESINSIILFEHLSSKSTLKASLSLMINKLLLMNATEDINTFKSFVNLFFKSISVSQNKDENSKFGYLLMQSTIQSLLKNHRVEYITIYLDEFEDYNYTCLVNSFDKTYYDNFLFIETIYNESHSMEAIQTIIISKLDKLLFEENRLLSDENIEIEYANLYIKASFKNLDGLECLEFYNKLFSSALKKENFNLLHLLLDRINDEILKIDISDADIQLKFLEIYNRIIKNVVMKSNISLFSLIYSHYNELLQKLDSDKKISKRVLHSVTNEYNVIASRCLETNNTEICNIVTNELHEFILDLKIVSGYDEYKNVIDSIFEIGVRAIEYENVIIIKAVSNALGWICKSKGFDDRSKNIIKITISKLVSLYNLTTTVMENNSTTIFIGTAFIILGGVSESDRIFLPFNKVIMTELKSLKHVEYLSSSYQLRYHNSSTWNGSFDSPRENIKKFYKNISQELKIDGAKLS